MQPDLLLHQVFTLEQLLGWLLGVIVLSVGLGFAAGVWCAPWWEDWWWCRRTRNLRALAHWLITRMERCECQYQLRQAELSWGLTPEQWQRIEEWSARWQERSRQAQTLRRPRRLVEPPPTITWKKPSLPDPWGLPDRELIEQNLHELLRLTNQYQVPSAILMIGIDKFESLIQRFGRDGVQHIVRRLVNVLLKGMRHEDLLGSWAAGTFVLLMPQLTAEQARRLAESLRSAVRDHRFVVGDQGPEVLVTASFGLTVCVPGDSDALVLDRVQSALQRARRLGRSQLVVCDEGCPQACEI